MFIFDHMVSFNDKDLIKSQYNYKYYCMWVFVVNIKIILNTK